MKTINKQQLINELEPFADDAPIAISIGSESYPIDCVISGNGKVHLEANTIITPKKMGKKGGRKTTNNSPEAIRQREYTRKWRAKKEKENTK